MKICMENYCFSSDTSTGQDKTAWQTWRITGSDLTLEVKMNDDQYNGLFTKHEVKIVGYWPSSLLRVYELRQSPGPKFVCYTCKIK